jgi:hypothetical protein
MEMNGQIVALATLWPDKGPQCRGESLPLSQARSDIWAVQPFLHWIQQNFTQFVQETSDAGMKAPKHKH